MSASKQVLQTFMLLCRKILDSLKYYFIVYKKNERKQNSKTSKDISD